jgi:peptidoglycan/xylan/chitin deacetylase (PgdA/CDA1 family)
MKYKKQQRIVAITFDDGPHPVYTRKFAELLSKYNIPATFFCSGKAAEQFPGVVKLISEQGFEIGNHAYSHTSLRWRKWSYIMVEIEKTDAILKSIIGKEVTLFRPPYLRFGILLLFCLWKLKKKLVLADVSTKDYTSQNAEEIVLNVERKVKNGSVLLFHDGGKNQEITFQALEMMIPKLLEQGFQFVPVSTRR